MPGKKLKQKSRCKEVRIMSLRSVKKHLSIYLSFFKLYMKSRLIYRTDFVLGALSQTVNLIFSIAFLTLIFTQVESLQGWSFNEMLLLAGIGGLILNIHHIFFFKLYSLGDDYIVSGRFDRILVRPLNPLFQVYASYVSDDNISKVLTNIAVIAYAVSQIGTHLITPINLVYGVLAVLNGVMVLGAIFVTLSTTAFWTGRSKAVFWLFFRISDFRKYPLNIYSGSIQLMLVTIIPIAFASFFPTTFILGREDWRFWQMLTLVIGPVFYFLGYQFWKIGVSNYSSTGS